MLEPTLLVKSFFAVCGDDADGCINDGVALGHLQYFLNQLGPIPLPLVIRMNGEIFQRPVCLSMRGTEEGGAEWNDGRQEVPIRERRGVVWRCLDCCLVAKDTSAERVIGGQYALGQRTWFSKKAKRESTSANFILHEDQKLSLL